MKAPKFWYRKHSFWAAVLSPFSAIYGFAGKQKFRGVVPFESSLPVICVGNLVAGGAGKTPAVIALTQLLREQGLDPHILLRGYGGQIKGPVEVGRTAHRITDVGDEALLLAGTAPTWVSLDRGKGGEAIQRQGLATAILMDDGFQNPTLRKNLSFVVVDGKAGFGNGRVIPAGPLRESLASGLKRADAAIIIGAEDETVEREILGVVPDLPIFHGTLVPAEETEKFSGRKVVGFAGIARPEKFRTTLEDIGATVVGWHEFPDHYTYRMNQIWKIVDEATDKEAVAVTTEKDFVRLSAEAQKRVDVVSVTLAFQEEEAVRSFLKKALEHED